MPIKNKKFKKYLEKHLTKPFFIGYNDLAKEIWSRGQAVKTPPLHGGIRGSIPLEITKKLGQTPTSFNAGTENKFPNRYYVGFSA